MALTMVHDILTAYSFLGLCPSSNL